MTTTVTLPVRGMHCAACQARVQRQLERAPGVSGAAVNLLLNTATVTYDPAVNSPAGLVEEIAGRPVTECCDRSGRPRCGFLVDQE